MPTSALRHTVLSLLVCLHLPLATPLAFEYDEVFATRAVHLAGQAYCEPGSIMDGSNKQAVDGVTPYATWTNSSLQFYTAFDSENSAVVVAVRGSENVSNWIDNLEAWCVHPYEDKDICIHSGFRSEYESMQEALIEDVAATADKFGTDKVLLVGHSSGAANMIQFAFDIATHQFPALSKLNVLALYTYGVPRVGNPSYVTAFKAADIAHTRVTHYHDAVPHVPMSSLGFHHTAQEVWYNEDSSEFTVCDGSGEDEECSNSCQPLSCTSFDDHMTYMGVAIGISGC